MLFLFVFIELFCYLIFVFVDIISFFWLTYPCMIILKYNQTFGVLLFFLNPHICRAPTAPTPPAIFLSLVLLCVQLSFVLLSWWQMNMHSNAHISWKWNELLGEAQRCRSDQVFELSTPSPSKSSSREKSTFLHVRVTQKFSPSVFQCWSISTTLPEPTPPEGHWWGFFFPLL